MSTTHQTTTALLAGLFDPDNHAVWEEFHSRYRPIILAVARRLGLSEQDAADVAQETLVKFLQEYRAGKYDRDRGRLRTWIVSIAKFRVADLYRAKARQRERRGESAFEELPEEDHLNKMWDEECRHEILRRGFQELRESTKLDDRTIEVFKRLSIDQRKPADVAEEQSMSLDAVYKAKRRCLEQLRVILQRLNDAYEIHEVA
ncbi:MAG: RNA polymerase sigma factor [Phycisphaerales bacterium]|nr:RNA polymerase sigma factor [Phycisphaerales bacterium]